ncbi:MAG TPA: 5-(carboxyamino)imidazole ribonucleotide mutase [Thermoanaerobaculia bacterium]|nr:5-(carboxyamino)imidazole ribonucleotide mutase [Thermoanaerobaculia bacterium]
MSDSTPPRVGILMGSDSDWPVLEDAYRTLESFGVGAEVRVLSAHRRPEEVAQYARSAAARGLSVLIAAAGGAAHLPGVVAALTHLPVIGIPVQSKDLGGLDSLLSIVQMPSGVPVATMGINRAANAALFALQILATADPRLAERLLAYKVELAEKGRAADARVAASLIGT